MIQQEFGHVGPVDIPWIIRSWDDAFLALPRDLRDKAWRRLQENTRWHSDICFWHWEEVVKDVVPAGDMGYVEKIFSQELIKYLSNNWNNFRQLYWKYLRKKELEEKKRQEEIENKSPEKKEFLNSISKILWDDNSVRIIYENRDKYWHIWVQIGDSYYIYSAPDELGGFISLLPFISSKGTLVKLNNFRFSLVVDDTYDWIVIYDLNLTEAELKDLQTKVSKVLDETNMNIYDALNSNCSTFISKLFSDVWLDWYDDFIVTPDWHKDFLEDSFNNWKTWIKAKYIYKKPIEWNKHFRRAIEYVNKLRKLWKKK